MARTVFTAILAGGIGSRLWPLSRSSLPKQFLALATGQTMLQDTVLRMRSFPPPTVFCNAEHRFLAAHQLQEVGIVGRAVLEPAQRNTGPSVAIAALLAGQLAEDAIAVVLPADHSVGDDSAFAACIAESVDVASRGYIVTLGIPSTEPSTQYGYIRSGDAIAGQARARAVAAFHEKPNRDVAAKLVAEGWFWNSGMFIAPAALLLREIEGADPEMLRNCRLAVNQGRPDLGFFRLDETPFLACRSIAFDRLVMERTTVAAVVPATFSWSDLGSWDAMRAAEEHDDHGTAKRGNVVAIDVGSSYLRSEGPLIAAIGVSNVAVVATPDAVLVADRGRVEDIVAVLDKIRENGGRQHADHVTVHRPWGTYQVVDVGDRFQVKHIMVSPGGRISRQYHHHRTEHWIVVQGTARVTRGEEILILNENQSTYIPGGEVHCLENPGHVPLRIIEIQSGAYLGEDDIVRLDDKYGRDR